MTEKTIDKMTDDELAEHLAALHADHTDLLAEIEAASLEVERRAQLAVQTAVVSSLPESVRTLLESTKGLPEHVKHALVEARAAEATAVPTETDGEKA